MKTPRERSASIRVVMRRVLPEPGGPTTRTMRRAASRRALASESDDVIGKFARVCSGMGRFVGEVGQGGVEEDNVAVLAGLDGGAALAADGVAVGEGHGGEDARSLWAGESYDITIAFKPNEHACVETATVARGDAVLGAGSDEGALPAFGVAEHGIDCGAAEEFEGHEGRDGVAGETEVGDGVSVCPLKAAEGERLSGAHVDGPEADLAFASEDFFDYVEVAAGDAGGGDEEVAVREGLVDAGGEGLDGVASDIEDVGDAAALADGGGKAGGVGVVDLAGGEGLAGAEEFVAGREDGDAGAAVHGDGIEAEGGDDADLPDADDSAALEHDLSGLHVLADLTDVSTEGSGDIDTDGVGGAVGAEGDLGWGSAADRRAGALFFVGLLEGDDGVRTAGHGGAGHDADGFARADRAFVDLAGGEPADDAEGAGGSVGSAGGVGGADGVAIHGSVGHGGNVEAGDDIGGEHLADGIEEGDLLSLEWVEVFEDPCTGLFDGDHAGGEDAVGVLGGGHG